MISAFKLGIALGINTAEGLSSEEAALEEEGE